MDAKRPNHSALLDDSNIRRWHSNVSKGSEILADIYLRALGRFCNQIGKSPMQFISLPLDKMEDMLQDYADSLEAAGGYSPGTINSYLKAVKSWAAWNKKPIQRKIKVRNADRKPTLENERSPTQDELGRVLYSEAAALRTRVCIAFIAFSGCRLEVLGNYRGTDGIRIRDFPELEIRNDKIEFARAPAMLTVRGELSKSHRRYFTFLCEEGCGILKEYLERRMLEGETLSKDSPVVYTTTVQAKKVEPLMKAHGSEDITPFLRTTKIGETIRRAMRAVGLPWRPYVWRSYFDTNLMLAESKGMVTHAYQQFWMGHVGDIESEYTVRKNRLPDNVVEDMRKAYERASDLLQTRKKTSDVLSEEKLKNALKEQLMMLAGYSKEELARMDLSSLSNEDVQEAVRRKLAGMMNGNGSRQKVVPADSIEQFIGEGWEFVSSLPNGKVILKLPF